MPGNLEAQKASGEHGLTFIAVAADQDVNFIQMSARQHRHGIGWHEIAVNGGGGWKTEDARIRIPLLDRNGLGIDGSHAIQHSAWRFLSKENI
jgi:hypothetical protein